MALDRALREEELGGDLPVGEAHDHEPEHLLLPAGQRRRVEITSASCRQDHLTGQDGRNRRRERLFDIGLEHEAVGARFDRGANRRARVGRPHHDDARDG